ncbi:2-C-methyl-D-erythritol 4-phosphate cytidylyltransferase [Zafaria cholistanensis]|uniref:2-C-methyl-D-erythritol 4-phosphate cytidylyltransferase n=1 Tax=Zafaria cholistanensis TaxID=1682741 RepID=A0A5A7NPY9_9MICC|nr:2-C-methyl-D-erythritol 4-phosphate cytidylyltransferase [Zafaria cholistanensis]GER22870.1 2-C-methyl-D-erythritol 4-phosphate cytidylyltransferase [Zafaria cholistanensis]
MSQPPLSPVPERPGRAAVVIVAAGSGTRLGHGIPKALVPLAGRPLLAHAIDGALGSGVADRMVVVVPPGDTELTALCRGYAADGVHLACVFGGETRNESVRAGLRAIGPGVDYVLVHDAARCLTPAAVFAGVLHALHAGASAVIPAVPVVDTVKSVAPSAAPGIAPESVTGTPERAALRAVQTPQGFRLGELLRAHEAAASWTGERAAAVTDDAMLMELAGSEVFVVPGSVEALKVTTPLDLLLAEALVANGYEEQS